MKAIGVVFSGLMSIAALLAMVAFAGASNPCYTYPSRSVQTYYPTATYYSPPTLSLGYQPDQTELVAKVFEAFKEQVVKTESLHVEKAQLLQSLIANGVQPESLREAVQPPHPGAVLARQDCARCHDARDNAKKGKGYVFFTAGKFSGTAEELADMRDQVEYGKMPKDREWSDNEKFKFLSWVTRAVVRPAAQALPVP